jgi:hypothetical protein
MNARQLRQYQQQNIPHCYEGQDMSYLWCVAANFSSRWLGRADLSYTDLRLADISSVYFSSASLRGATLRGADLRNSSTYGADLINADLTGVIRYES